MKSVGNRCQELRQESEKLDYKWNDKALQVGGETLAEYILPAYRNFLSSHRFVLSPDDKLFCFGDTLGNVREAYKSIVVFQSCRLDEEFVGPCIYIL